MTKTKSIMGVIAQILGQEKRDYFEILVNWLPELERDILIEQVYELIEPYNCELEYQILPVVSGANPRCNIKKYHYTSQDIALFNRQFDELTKHYKDRGIWAWNVIEEDIPLDIDNLDAALIEEIGGCDLEHIEIPEALNQAVIWKRVSRVYRRQYVGVASDRPRLNTNHKEVSPTTSNSSRIWHKIKKNLSSYDRLDTLILDPFEIQQKRSQLSNIKHSNEQMQKTGKWKRTG